MVGDHAITKAVSRILQRSERQDDPQKILGTFVDVGILRQLDNINNQIFYGRRGTGKTHVLRVLGSHLQLQDGTAVLYIDARTLGSTAQFSDPSLLMRLRCLSLFRDVLAEIHGTLLEHIIYFPPTDAEGALKACDALLEVIADEGEEYVRQQMTSTDKVTASSTNSAGLSGTLATSEASVAGSLEASGSAGAESVVESKFEVRQNEKVVFPALHTALSRVLDMAGARLFILFDEWSSLPADVQPYLAEFLKRGILPVSRAVLKIGSLEYRSHFSFEDGKSRVGFELGADISAAQDLDDYYVFDRNPGWATSAYADMVYRHIGSELPANYLRDKFGVNDGSGLIAKLFTGRETFAELARAAEGVVRDLINIFTIAYFHAFKTHRTNIDRKSVVEAARAWFEQDKARYLDDELRHALRRIVDEVIGSKRARSFMVPRELERDPVLLRLFDARVLHQMQRSYADKDNPGVRYNIYTLDYGTYVDLIGTSRAPLIELEEALGLDTEIIVPFDDKRSIRRIVLGADILKPNATMVH